MKKLKKFTLRYIFESFFYRLEENFPKFSKFLRFHSVVRAPNFEEGLLKEDIEIYWFENKYVSKFKQLATIDEIENLDFSKNETTELITISTKNFFIDGHIKAPVRKTDNTLIAFNGDQRLRWGDVFPQPIFIETQLDGHVIFIPNIENYYHLMVDYILPALHRIRFDQKFVNEHVYFVSQRHLPILDFFVEYLISIGFKSKVVRIFSFQRIYGKTLILGRANPRDPGCYFVFTKLINDMDLFIENKILGIEVPDFAYIKRNQTPRRQLLNEEEIVSSLKNFGFEAVSLNFDNFLYQIALFRKAKILVSVHGASLTNLIWSKNAKVIELFPKNLRPKHYLNISAQLDLDYHAILGELTEGRENFRMDLSDLLNFFRTN